MYLVDPDRLAFLEELTDTSEKASDTKSKNNRGENREVIKGIHTYLRREYSVFVLTFP
jgi:hypothetical protein